ncbi:MAG: hypothetical protein ABIG85_05965, partial [Chloroflexota bacterium]
MIVTGGEADSDPAQGHTAIVPTRASPVVAGLAHPSVDGAAPVNDVAERASLTCLVIGNVDAVLGHTLIGRAIDPVITSCSLTSIVGVTVGAV